MSSLPIKTFPLFFLPSAQSADHLPLQGWLDALALCDKDTETHAWRVAERTVRFARFVGIGEDELVHIHHGTVLHDVGKLCVPTSILRKSGPLTPTEWALMRYHPVYAYELLSHIPDLRPALDIPYCHHEKWDGTGYPRRLKHEQIPFAARLFAVVDVWDALCSDRPYRSAWPEVKVLEHLRTLSGTNFDPEILQLFLEFTHAGNPTPIST
jgi:HD-GYP domain-containing protein (c-di-GMP phosphodiesterase class II)